MSKKTTILAFYPAFKRGNLRPTFIAKSILALTPDFLKDNGFEGFATDLDGVFLDHDQERVDPQYAEVAWAIAKAGMPTGLLSNVKPGPRELRVDTAAADMHIGTVIKPSDCNGIIKPHTLPFEALADKMGVPKAKIMFAGDQLVKDILGANAAQFGGSLLVDRLGDNDHPAVARYQRPLETQIRRSLRGIPARTEDFPDQITRV